VAAPRPERILLAEDNAINQRVALAILADLGFQADVAKSGVEALAALERNDYDLVLMDCQMPEMDGYQAARAIRAPLSKVRNRELPIISVTAHALASHRDASLAAGMNDHLTKPIDRDQLAAVLDRWLSPRMRAPASPPAPAPGGRLDREALIRRLSGDGSLAADLIAIFFDEVREKLAQLRSAANDGRMDVVQLTAHTIKGAAVNVHASRLAELASSIEALHDFADGRQAQRLIDELDGEFSALCEASEILAGSAAATKASAGAATS
jgi:CheY-like chemotaxis protein/HPt (histidine-containing phosphotransfer) domain-containing protein